MTYATNIFSNATTTPPTVTSRVDKIATTYVPNERSYLLRFIRYTRLSTGEEREAAMITSRKKNSPRAATLADVGREAGVSVMIASAILNGTQASPHFGPRIRDRILTAAARLRYRTETGARAFPERRINTLGIAAVLNNCDLNGYLLELFNGVTAEAVQRKQNTTVFALRDWEKDAVRIFSLFDGPMDGLILIAPQFSQRTAQQLSERAPIVSLNANTSFPSIVNVESDEEAGTFDMVTRLIALGHRRVLHVTGKRGWLSTQRRIRGYQRALLHAGIPYDETLLVEAAFDGHAGKEAWYRWIEQSPNRVLPEAVFCFNDGIALGCMDALLEMGLRVPEDISVVGFDDTQSARTSVPRLATVRQPHRAMAARAVDALLEAIDHRNDLVADDVSPFVFPTEVVMRESVAAPCSSSRVVTLERKSGIRAWSASAAHNPSTPGSPRDPFLSR